MKALFTTLTLAFFSSFLMGCEKPAPTFREYQATQGPEQEFDRIVNALTMEQYELESADPSSWHISTTTREVPVGDLAKFTTLSSDITFYRGGRVAYDIDLTDEGGVAKVRVNARVEAKLKPKQSAQSLAPEEIWMPQTSNGGAEQRMVAFLTR